MRVFKSNNWLRDIIFLGILVFLIKTVLLEYGPTYLQQMHNAYAVHEIDPLFLKQTKEVSKQLQTIRKQLEATDAYSEDMEKTFSDLHQETTEIFEKYASNSPALGFLGPIGTTSIVLKEQGLEKRLLKTVNKLSSLLHGFATQNKGLELTFKSATSIEEGLQTNRDLIRYLIN